MGAGVVIPKILLLYSPEYMYSEYRCLQMKHKFLIMGRMGCPSHKGTEGIQFDIKLLNLQPFSFGKQSKAHFCLMLCSPIALEFFPPN